MSDDIAPGRRPQPHLDDDAYSARHDVAPPLQRGGQPQPARQWGDEEPRAEPPAVVPTATHPPPLPPGQDGEPAAVPPTMSIDLGDAAAPQPTYDPTYPEQPFDQPLLNQPVPPPTLSATASESVTCPECGAQQEVYLNRRDATDFCKRCDFPLFWTPSRVERDRAAASQGESLRRLPGTAGRSTLASARCPHCAEPNPVRAETCIRCGRSMHPVALPPPAAPPPPPPPPVVVETIPERHIAWWIWVLVGVFLVAAVTVVVLVITGVIG